MAALRGGDAARAARHRLAPGAARRLANPQIAVLLLASLVSAFSGDALGFGLIAVIVALGTLLDMLQEHRAGHAVDALRAHPPASDEPLACPHAVFSGSSVVGGSARRLTRRKAALAAGPIFQSTEEHVR